MVTLDEIEKARETIQGMIEPTPLLFSDSISANVGTQVYLKLETAGFDHIREILGALKEENYAVEQDPTCPVV